MNTIAYEDDFHFSEKIRECWKLWNLGFPCVRPIGYRNGKVWYFESFVDERTEIDPVHVFSFLVDLFRLGEMDIISRYEVKITKDYGAPYFRLVPTEEMTYRDVSLKLHLIDLAEQALALLKVDYDLDYESPSLNGFYDYSWICGCLKGLEIRVIKPSSGDYFNGPCYIEIFDIDEGKVTIVLNIEDEKYRIYTGIHGNLFTQQFDSNSNSLLSFPAFCTLSSNSPEWSRTLTKWGQNYWGQNLYSTESKQGEIQKNVLLTLEAEIENEQKYCVQYTVEDEFKPHGGWIRIHPNPGTNINAYTFWDMGIESGDMNIALNQSNDIQVWNDNDKWLLINIDESDPFKLMIRSQKDSKKRIPNNSGFLKPANIGTTSLLQRKQTIVEEGIKRNDIITEPIPYPESADFNFMSRLESQGTLQLIQGPPGTGKTWTATKIVEEALEWNPAYRILLSAKEHLALDHLCQTVGNSLEETGHRVVRIRSSSEEYYNLSEEMDYYSPAQVGLRIVDQIALKIRDEEKKEKLLESRFEKGVIATWVEDLAIHTAAVVCVTTLDSKIESLLINNQDTFDLAIIEEAGKSYPSEIIGPMSLSMNTLLIGDQQQLPPFELQSIENSLQTVIKKIFTDKQYKPTRNQRIIKELEIAPWNETTDYKEIQETSLESSRSYLQPFNHWFYQYRKSSSTLNDEWRMFRELSDIIGEIFYSGPFNWKKQNRYSDQELPAPWKNRSRLLLIDHPHASKGEGKEEASKGGSIRNLSELKTALPIFRELVDKKYDIVFLSPYLGQVASIRSYVPKEYHNRIRTVDGFQGREADFIVFSLVRNNTRTGNRRWGFVSDPRRLNVALSRAREAMVVLTSVQHIEETDWENENNHLFKFLESVKLRGKILNLSELWGDLS